jgi:hypothetical protein
MAKTLVKAGSAMTQRIEYRIFTTISIFLIFTTISGVLNRKRIDAPLSSGPQIQYGH